MKEKKTIHHTFPYPSNFLVDIIVLYGGRLDSSFLNLYEDTPDIIIERPSSFPEYIPIAIRKDLCYCYVDF